MTETMAEADGARRMRSQTMRHLAAIRALAAEMERPLEEIGAVYQCELQQLAARAAVTDYLPVLVTKRVRQLYQHRMQALRDDPCARLIPAF